MKKEKKAEPREFKIKIPVKLHDKILALKYGQKADFMEQHDLNNVTFNDLKRGWATQTTIDKAL